MIDDASSLGLKIEPPDINKSLETLSLLRNYFIGLGSIKGVEKCYRKNLWKRKKDFESLKDFV